MRKRMILTVAVFLVIGGTLAHSQIGSSVLTTIATELRSFGGVPPGGFTIDLSMPTDEYSGTSKILCAAGNMGNGAYGGHNCLIQYNREDFQGYAFGIVENQPGGGQFPQFRVRRSGETVVNQLSVVPKNTGSPYYNPAAFDMSGLGHHGHGELHAVNDIPGNYFPTFSFWGLADIYGSPVPPIGNIWGNVKYVGGIFSGTKMWEIRDNGQLVHGGSTPGTPSSCGSNPSVIGNDNVFFVTIGTSPGTTCIIPFAHEWAATRVSCVAQSQTQPVAIASIANSTQASLTGSAEWTANSVVQVICRGQI